MATKAKAKAKAKPAEPDSFFTDANLQTARKVGVKQVNGDRIVTYTAIVDGERIERRDLASAMPDAWLDHFEL